MMIDTKTLKSGDEVAVWLAGRNIACRYRIALVKSVSPTGRVRLTDGRSFSPSGDLMGHKNSFRGPDTLRILTDALRKEIADCPAVNVIMGFTDHYDPQIWGTLPTDALRQIAAIIEANIPKEPASGE